MSVPDSWPTRIGIPTLGDAAKMIGWVKMCLSEEDVHQSAAASKLQNALEEINQAIAHLTLVPPK